MTVYDTYSKEADVIVSQKKNTGFLTVKLYLFLCFETLEKNKL